MTDLPKRYSNPIKFDSWTLCTGRSEGARTISSPGQPGHPRGPRLPGRGTTDTAEPSQFHPLSTYWAVLIFLYEVAWIPSQPLRDEYALQSTYIKPHHSTLLFIRLVRKSSVLWKLANVWVLDHLLMVYPSRKKQSLRKELDATSDFMMDLFNTYVNVGIYF